MQLHLFLSGFSFWDDIGTHFHLCIPIFTQSSSSMKSLHIHDWLTIFFVGRSFVQCHPRDHMPKRNLEAPLSICARNFPLRQTFLWQFTQIIQVIIFFPRHLDPTFFLKEPLMCSPRSFNTKMTWYMPIILPHYSTYFLSIDIATKVMWLHSLVIWIDI